jgi:ABC-type Fe3+ transport system substrate-binding protein
MIRRGIGLIIVAMAIGIGLYFYFSANKLPDIELEGYIGGEKIGIFENQKIQAILKEDYSISIDYVKLGSIEMVRENTGGKDFLFPSGQFLLDFFKEKQRNRLLKSSNPFNSPIVLYSWDVVTKALEREGIVSRRDGVYFADMAKLLHIIEAQKSWEDIGLKDIYGKVSVITTDPTKSNSGNQFVGLLAKVMNDGNGISEENLDRILNRLHKIYSQLGYLEHSSADLFTKYLRTGVGANPIIAGYESQMIEMMRGDSEIWNQFKNEISIIYPEPTVWSSQILIALKANAKRLVEAFKDEEIQKIVWEDNGFRSGLTENGNDSLKRDLKGIAPKIQQVISMPTTDIMIKIINWFHKMLLPENSYS